MGRAASIGAAVAVMELLRGGDPRRRRVRGGSRSVAQGGEAMAQEVEDTARRWGAAPRREAPPADDDPSRRTPPAVAEKARWRRRMRAAWRELSPAALGAISAAICRRLRTLLEQAAQGATARAGAGGPPWGDLGGLPREVRGLMLYAPMPTEVDVSPLLEWARRRGIAVLLPWIEPAGGRMEARRVGSWDELVPAPGRMGPWRLRQPSDDAPRWVPGPDTVVVVPGLAFDRQGWRLGRGGGYYDRFLARCPAAWRVAVAPARMVVDRLPRDPHDRRMDLIVTEDGVHGPWWGIR